MGPVQELRGPEVIRAVTEEEPFLAVGRWGKRSSLPRDAVRLLGVGRIPSDSTRRPGSASDRGAWPNGVGIVSAPPHYGDRNGPRSKGRVDRDAQGRLRR